MAMPLQACTQYTHLARIHTRKKSRACGSSFSSSHWSVLCVRCLQSIHYLARMPCFASCLTRPDFTFTEHSYLIFSVVPFTVACHFHSANWTLVWPICRTVSAHTRSALVTNRGFASVTDPIANCGSREDHRNPCSLSRREDRLHARFPDQGHTARGRLRAHGWQIVVLPAPLIRA